MPVWIKFTLASAIVNYKIYQARFQFALRAAMQRIIRISRGVKGPVSARTGLLMD